MHRLTLFFVLIFLTTACKQSHIDDFFYVPWPSDTRTVAGGNVLASGQVKSHQYPGAESGFTKDIYQILANHLLYRQGALNMDEQKFGVNSGIFFTFDQALAHNAVAIDPLSTADAASPIQLVNIDPNSAQHYQRVPLRLDFKRHGTTQRPENVLTLLPYPGFTLEFASQYAAIVFNDIPSDANTRLEKKQLYRDIEQPWRASMPITRQQHALWQQHRTLVQNYVTHLGRSMDEVIAYTVYSTQHPAQITLSLKQALHTLDDEDIINMVLWEDQDPTLKPRITWSSCNVSGGWNWLTMNVRIPRWQKGVFPYLLSGGSTHFTLDNGKLVIPDDHEIVPVEVAIPCKQHDAANAYIVVQNGNGSGAEQAAGWGTFDLKFETRGKADVLIIGAGDLISGYDRRDQPGINNALKLIRSIPDAMNFSDGDILPAIRNGYFNAVAARGNMRQAAAESYLLKRVAENLKTIVARLYSDAELANHGLTLANFAVDKSRAGFMGFSQGANNGIVSMAMADHYDFAYLGSGVGIDLPLVSQKPLVSELLHIVFPDLEYQELDDFHPIASFVQMGFEAMDSSNYVSYIQPRNLFITAGQYDLDVPAAATEHLALALARRGLIQPTAGNQGRLLDVPSFQTLGIAPLTGFPISGNIHAGQGTGVYSLGAHDHEPCGDLGGFLFSASRGSAATLRLPCY